MAADRIPTFLLRVLAIAVLVLCVTAGLTYAAGSSLPISPAAPAETEAAAPPLVVPDVRGQAYVFAKGTLEESGFAWKVAGSAQGYPANMVVAQSPAAGMKLIDTGTPLITLTLRRNGSYPQNGEPENASSYPGTVIQPAATEGLGPALRATTPAETTPAATTPAATTPAATTPAATTPDVSPAPATNARATKPPATRAPAKKPLTSAAKWPQSRPAAFIVPGAAKEPLDEMPLPNRAQALMKWLDAHPRKTPANVEHWLFQHQWIVTGAKMGWWHGAVALRTLAAVDQRTQQLWGIGAASHGVVQQALADVQARTKS
jgi:PASTA domain